MSAGEGGTGLYVSDDRGRYCFRLIHRLSNQGRTFFFHIKLDKGARV